MPKVQVNQDSHRALIEEHWWEGILGYDKVDVHGKVYRCDHGPRTGQYWAEAHVHRPGGGGMVVSGGLPKLEAIGWHDSPDKAVDDAIRRLESRDDVQIK